MFGRILRPFVAACLAACALVSARAAIPVATWTDFSKPSCDGYTLTIDNSCIIGKDGSVTIGAYGGLTLSLSTGDPIRTGKLVTVVVDVEGILPTGDKRTVLAIKTAGGNFANLTKNADNVIYSKADDTSNYGNIGNVSTIGRSQLAYAYSNMTGTDAWIEGAKKATGSGLRWQNSELTDIFIGSCDGTSQVMQGLKIRKLTIYADKLVTAAEICSNGPAYFYKFNGNYDSLGSSSLTFNGENNNNYSVSPSGQALKIVNGSTHPYGGNWSYGSGNWSVTTFAKPIADASNKIVLWTTGVKGGWFGLLSDSANNKAILASGNDTGITTTICSVDVPNISDFFHLYTVRFVGNNTYELIVDGNVAEKSSASYTTTVPTGNFQIGAVKSGLPTGLARTTGTLIDDFREYQRKLADEEVKALAAGFVAPETISINVGGGRGTGDLAANSDKLVQDSECAGLAPVPGAGWNNLAKEWQQGASAKKFTMAAGTVKVTDGTKLIARDTVAVTVSANNTYDGGASRVNSYHKGYLDDGDYDGHKAYIKVTGIPYPRYNVIIYAATDATDVQYSSYKVNGVEYAWTTSTVQGTAAWGDRNATDTAYGKNALIAQAVVGETLEVEGTANGGRGGIAAIQVIDAGATQSRVVSVNFGSDRTAVTAGTDPGGILADKNWWNVPNGSGTDVAIDTAKVTFDAAGTWSGNATQRHLKSYLDENRGGSAYPINITVKDLEDGEYDVYLYCESSDDATGWTYKTVNGVNYYGDADGESVVGTESWGVNGTTSVMGENVMVVRKVTKNAEGNIVIGSQRNGQKRGCISAIQLKKLPQSTDYVATVTKTADWSSLEWSPARPSGGFPPSANFTLTNTATAATLTLDEDVDANRVTVVGASGKDLVLEKGEGRAVSASSYNFARAQDKVIVVFDTGAASVVAGGDTVVNGGGTGVLTIDDGMKATVKNGVWDTIVRSIGSTLRYEGTTALSSLPCTTGNNGSGSDGTVVYAAPVANQDEVAFVYSLTRDFEDGFSLETTRFVCGNKTGTGNPNPVQVFNQHGGTITVTGTTGPGANTASTLFAHLTSTVTYALRGGTFEAENAAIQFGWDGTVAMTVGGGDGAALLRTKGVWQKVRNVASALVLEANGVIELGSDGIQFTQVAPTVTLNGGTVRAYDNATITVANTNGLKIAGPVTFEAAAGKALFLASDNIVAGGSVTVGGEGTVVFRNCRDAVPLTGTAKVGYVVTANDQGAFPIPSGMSADDIRLYDGGGSEIAVVGHDETHIFFNADLYGRMCLMEYLYKGNLASTGTDTGAMQFDGTHCFPGNEYVTNALGEKVGGIYAASAPWRNVSFPSEVTVVTYGKMMATSNTCQIGIGSTTQGSKYSLFLASGDVSKNEVVLGYAYNNSGGNVAESGVLCRMTVPNAQSVDHLYAFTMQQVGGKTVVNVYLDGKLLQPYTFSSAVTLGSGIQLGSIHGGVGNNQDWPADFGFKRSTDAETGATISFLRIYDQKLSDDVIKEIAQDYPYVSSNGRATRTVGANGMWRQDASWTQWSHEGIATTQAAPDSNTTVSVTMAGDAALTMNLGLQANYEEFAVEGTGKLTLAQGAGAVAPIVVGRSTIGVDMTVDYRSFVFGGNVDVSAGKTLTFDFAALDLGAYYSSTTIKLTGVATLGDGARVLAKNLVQVSGRTATFVKDEATKQYHLVITVEDHPFVYTVSKGQGTGVWSWKGQVVDAKTVAAQSSGAIEKAGDGIAELAPQAGMTYNVKKGTLKFTQPAMVDCLVTNVAAGAVLDLNGVECGSATKTVGFVVTLNGGTLANSNAERAILRSLTLVKNSVVDVSNGAIWLQSGSEGYSTTTLALGSNTLVKTGNGQFGVVTTTVTGSGTIDVRAGELWVQENSVFGTATVKIGEAGMFHVRVGKRATVATVVSADGGVLANEGEVSAFALGGTLKLAGAGTYGTITLDDALLDIGTKRGLALASNGKVNVTLTAAEEAVESRQIDLFTAAQGAAIALNKVTNAAGEDITDQCTLDGGRITIGQQAQIGTVKYATLADAIAVVRDGQTIELLRASTLSGSITNAFTIDMRGCVMTGRATEVMGALEIMDSATEEGCFVLLEQLSVVGGGAGRLVLNGIAAAGGGSVCIGSGGTLANAGATLLEGIGLVIEKDGRLDLSAGTELACRDFASAGRVVGTNATLVVKGTLDALTATAVNKLALTEQATLKGAGLKVVTSLTLGGTLAVVADAAQAGERLATVPETSEFSTAATLNGEGGYVVRRTGTALCVVREAVVTAHVAIDTTPGTNFESLDVAGSVGDWSGSGHGYGKTNVYVVATSEKTGVSVTQIVDYVAGPSGVSGTFEAKFEDVESGDTYTVSAHVRIGHGEGETETQAQSRNADVVVARPIDDWIYEDAKTFAGEKPGTGLWAGYAGIACATNDVIRFLMDNWNAAVDFQPTNVTLAVRSSQVKDIHYKVAFLYPGFYLCEKDEMAASDQFAAVTVAADEETDECFFAVAGATGWQIVPHEVFMPRIDEEYEVVIRVDYAAREIMYGVVFDGSTVRLATVPIGSAAEDFELAFYGAGDVAEIVGVCQDAHLMQVGDEEFWTFDDAWKAAGSTNSIIPLWKSRYEVSGVSGKFRILDERGLLELGWRKWHHWGIEDGAYRYVSGNNWIEYADESGVVPSDGGWLVTNEVGLAWLAEQATNRWICGDVTLGGDLDLSSKNWTPVAQFAGTFDGSGFAIAGLNNTNVNYDPLLVRDGSGYYFGGPSNDWGRAAYGLFASATNAAFRNVAFEGVAISNVSESVAPLLGVLAGGDLVVSNVTVASGLVQGAGGAVAGLVGTADGWNDVAVVGNELAADVAALSASAGDPRWAAGVMTVGGAGGTVGALVVTGNVVCGTVANTVYNNADGGNVAQVLAGTTWGTQYGEVVLTNNVVEGSVRAEVLNHNAWRFDYEEWVSEAFPIVNLAAAVVRTSDGCYRRFVEATAPESVPIDPVHRTARMRADRFANGADNIAGWWMDTITTMPDGGHIDIVGTGNLIETWESVSIDRNLSFNLNSNFVYTVYDSDTFTLADGVSATVSNGVVYVGNGYEAFAGDTSGLVTNDVTVVKLDEDFYERTVLLVDGDFLYLSEAMDRIHAGSCIELFDGTGLTIDTAANAVLLDGKKIADLPVYQSLVAAGDGGTLAYMVRLNEKAVPEYDFEMTGAAAGHDAVQIRIVGARAGFYYAVQHKASLVENWSEPANKDWVRVESDGSVVQFSIPAAESSGFYRIKVTDYLAEEE